MGRRLGDPTDPLLVSVRSGAKSSMPGMMETVLDVGLNDVSVLGLARQSGSDRFAWDSYRRLVQMFGATVLGVDSRLFAQELDAVKTARGATQDLELTTSDLKRLVTTYTGLIESQTGRPSRRTPTNSCTWRSPPSSTPGTPTVRVATAARSTSPRTSGPR